MVKDFFNKYPNAKKVLVVGDKLFMVGFEKEAKRYADAIKAAVQEVERPQPMPKKRAAEQIEVTIHGTT